MGESSPCALKVAARYPDLACYDSEDAQRDVLSCVPSGTLTNWSSCQALSDWSLWSQLLCSCSAGVRVSLPYCELECTSSQGRDLLSPSIILFSVPCVSEHSRWLSHKSILLFFFSLCSSNYPFLSALPCICLHWTSSDFMLPIHLALLNVIEIEFGLGGGLGLM